MSQFVVSARKYRPVKFDDVVGQNHITVTLKNALKNHQLAHAFLFCGPRGVGKTTSARILAKVINCTNLTPDFEACNECVNCNAFNENSSFNIFELDAASNNGVDEMRELTQQVRIPPQNAKYKVYIIDEVHMLTTQAFNAFLKTLEEPPPYAIFILATTEKHKIIPTILSRCQVFDFHRIQTEEMVAHLKKIATDRNVIVTDDSLHLIAQKADGGLRDALSLFDKMANFCNGSIELNDVVEQLNILDYDYHFRFTDAFLAQDIASVYLLFNDILLKGFEGDSLILGLAEHFRNLLFCMSNNTVKLLDCTENIKQKYINQAAIVSPAFILSALQIISETDVQYKQAKNKRLHIELALTKICFITAALNFNTSGQTESKKKTTDTVIEKSNSNTTTNPVSINTVANPIAQTPSTTTTNKIETATTSASTSVSASNKMQGSAYTAPSKVKLKGTNFLENLSIQKKEEAQKVNIQVSTETATALDIAAIPVVEEPSVNTTANRKPYSPMEKFNYFTAQNPALIELTELMQLEVLF